MFCISMLVESLCLLICHVDVLESGQQAGASLTLICRPTFLLNGVLTDLLSASEAIGVGSSPFDSVRLCADLQHIDHSWLSSPVGRPIDPCVLSSSVYHSY